MLAPFSGSLCTRWGSHVLITKDSFFDRTATGEVCMKDGRCATAPTCEGDNDCPGGGTCLDQGRCAWSYSALLGNWLNDRPGPTKLTMLP